MQVQIKFRSPKASSVLLTVGQNLLFATNSNGNAACSRVYLNSQVSAVSIAMVCGAFLRILLSSLVEDSSISLRIEINASQNRSSSALLSLSVGSIIKVPPTGKDTVGAWKP